MSPELTLLIINAVLMGYAYLWAYPSLPEKTWQAIAWRDVAGHRLAGYGDHRRGGWPGRTALLGQRYRFLTRIL